MIKDYIDALRRYADFSGRSSRSQFWYFVLASALVGMILGVVSFFVNQLGMWLVGLYYVASFIPSLAIAVRRLHDINKSGWWILIGFVPFVGGLVLFVFYCMKSVDVGNRFGGETVPLPPMPPVPPTPTAPAA